MHGRIPQRLLHVRRAHLENRKDGNNGDDNDNGYNNHHQGSSGFAFAGPITLTVTEFVEPSTSTATMSSSTSSTTTSSSSPSVSETEMPNIGDPNYGDSLPSSSLTSFSFPSPSIIETGSANGSNSKPVSGSAKPSTLSSGALIGIILACMAVLIGSIIYALRRRYVRRRIRLRKEWANSKRVRASLGISPSSYEPKEPYPTSSLSPAIITQTQNQSTERMISYRPPALPLAMAPYPMPPPASYGNYTPVHPPTSQQTPTVGLGLNKSLPPTTPIYESPAVSMLSPFATKVVATFITSLPDELSISVGETIRVLAEYDDGWALCLNGRGEQGMVPFECLDRGFAGDSSTRDMGSPRRVSSLNASSRRNMRRY